MLHSSIQKAEKALRKNVIILISGLLFVLAVISLLFSYFGDESRNVIIRWIVMRSDIILLVLLIGSLGAVGYYYWRKPWRYLDAVISAVESIFIDDDKAISLPEPLHEIESYMNQVKIKVLTSEKNVAQAEERKDELVMCLAHDIRTPLTTVIGYLNLLHEIPDMEDEQRQKYIDIVLKKSERLESLVNELFDFTRLKTNISTLNKTVIDLQCLISQISDELYPSFLANENTVNIKGHGRLDVCADAEKIARAFGNLLKNAATYSEKGSEIKISLDIENEDAIVSIQNKGDNIAKEDLEIMFEKFKRLDKARNTYTGGAGLGLSIAKEIIELHGGSIVAQSENQTINIITKIPIL